MKIAALDRRLRDGADRFLSWARRRLGRIAVVFAGLGLVLLAFRIFAPEHGLRGQYFSNAEWSAPPVATRLDRVISFPKEVLSVRAGDSELLSAVWEGYVFAPKNSAYAFTVRADDGARVYVDETLVAAGGAPPSGQGKGEVELGRGSHRLRIEYFDAGGDGAIDFRWREIRTARWLMPRLPLYPRPVGMGLFVWDTIQYNLAPVVETGVLIAGLLLLLAAARAAFPLWETLQILALSGFVVLAGVYEAEVFAKKAKAVSGCDTFAYLHGAELMARNGIFRTEYADPLAADVIRAYESRPGPEELTFLFAPLGYYMYNYDQGLAYNVFPPGLSLLLYPIVKLFGRAPAFFLLPGLNAALLLLLFWLGTRAAGAAFGLVLAAVTFFNFPVFETSVIIMSDLPSLGLLGLAAFFLYRGFRSPRLSYPLLAGALFGFAFLIRYSNLVAAVPLAYLFWRWGRTSRGFGRLAAQAAAFAGAAVVVGALPLALYTHRLFGTVLRLVYEPFSQSRLAWENLGPGISYYGSSLLRTFGPATLVAAAVGVFGGFFRPKRRPAVLFCLLALAAFFLFFAFQSIQNERYLMPVYPCLGCLAAFGLIEITSRLGRSFVLTVAVLALVGAAPLLRSKGTFRAGEVQAEDTVTALARKLPAGAVVFAEELTGPVRFYAGLTGYRFLPAQDSTLLETAAILGAKGRPVFFYLDGPAAEDRFRGLVGRNEAFRTAVRDLGRFRGRPLFEYSRPPSSNRTPPR